MRRAVANFDPAPGALYEVPLARGDEVRLISTGDGATVPGSEAPAGWLYIRHASSGLQGLVPESFVSAVAGESDEEKDAEDLVSNLNAHSLEGTQDTKSLAVNGAADGASDALLNSEKEVSSAEYVDDAAAAAMEEAARANWRLVVANFKPEAGAAFELKLEKNDGVEIILVDYTVPQGWVVVRPFESQEVGLVPEACLAPWPVEEKSGPTLEELKEEAERALGKTIVEKRSVLQQLADTEKQLQGEQQRLENALAAERLEKAQREESSTRADALSHKLQQLELSSSQNAELVKQLETMPRVMAIVEGKLEEDKRLSTDNTRLQKIAAESAQGETGDDESNHLLLRTAQAQRDELKAALLKIEQSRTRAAEELDETELKIQEAEIRAHAKEEAARTKERTMRLLPRVRELLRPTQEEMRAYVETMTAAVMKNAEEAAVVLLETLARTNDPQEAIKQSLELRATRSATGFGVSGSGGRTLHRFAPTHRSGSDSFKRDGRPTARNTHLHRRDGHRLAPPRPATASAPRLLSRQPTGRSNRERAVSASKTRANLTAAYPSTEVKGRALAQPRKSVTREPTKPAAFPSKGKVTLHELCAFPSPVLARYSMCGQRPQQSLSHGKLLSAKSGDAGDAMPTPVRDPQIAQLVQRRGQQASQQHIVRLVQARQKAAQKQYQQQTDGML